MINIRYTSCCGVLEIDNLSHFQDPKDAFMSIMGQLPWIWQRMQPPFLIFTGVVKLDKLGDGLNHSRVSREDDYSQTFTDFIEKNHLGTVVPSEVRRNWSGNDLRLSIWHIDYNKCLKLYDKLEFKDATK